MNSFVWPNNDVLSFNGEEFFSFTADYELEEREN